MSDPAALLCVCVLLALTAGCATDTRGSDLFVGDAAGFSPHSATHTALAYLPNRIVDGLDLVHVGVACGTAAGVELQATRALRFRFASGNTLGLGWFGRKGRAAQASAYRHRPFQQDDIPEYALTTWHVPFWDLGLHLHLGVVTVLVGVAPVDEGLDLLAGLFTFDLKGDDF